MRDVNHMELCRFRLQATTGFPQTVYTSMKFKVKYSEAPKRITDLAGAALLVTVTSPVFVIAACLIKLDSFGPILFKQRRLTQNGKVFTMYKFRTMVVDAEDQTGAVWASVKDHRVTRLGSFLRRTRIDELPQLFNVLKGEMSLIGPRPERPEFSERLSKELPRFNKRLDVKAGLTGLAQTRLGYSSTMKHYRRKVDLDSIYIDNCCLLLDMRIALRTVSVLITGFGAR